MDADYFKGESYTWMDPVDGVLAGVFPQVEHGELLGNIQRRAIRIIAEIPTEDIKQHLVQAESLFEIAYERIRQQSEKYDTSDVVTVMADMRDSIILDEVESIQWHHYFALNAIKALAEYVFFSEMNPGFLHVDYDDPVLAETSSEGEAQEVLCNRECMFFYAVAVESVSRAEVMLATLQRSKSIDVEAECRAVDKISQRNRNAAEIRHKPVKELKRQFAIYRIERGASISTIQAARDFYDQLPSDKRKLLSPTNGPETLARSFSKRR